MTKPEKPQLEIFRACLFPARADLRQPGAGYFVALGFCHRQLLNGRIIQIPPLSEKNAKRWAAAAAAPDRTAEVQLPTSIRRAGQIQRRPCLTWKMRGSNDLGGASDCAR